MWTELPVNIAPQSATSIANISSKPVTIEDIIETTNAFWKTMNSEYQKTFEEGQRFFQIDETSTPSVIKSILQSFILFYKNKIIQSSLSIDIKEEEMKKINLLESQLSHIEEIFNLLKIPVDKKMLYAYILGCNVNIYQRSKSI